MREGKIVIMSVKCKTAEELGKAIKNNEDTIEIEGNLKNEVFRIKATGKVAWGVCAASLAFAITAYVLTLEATAATAPVGGAGGAVFAFGGTAALGSAATMLGSAAIPALIVGISAGGIGALNTLRDKYKIVEKNKKYIKLKRK